MSPDVSNGTNKEPGDVDHSLLEKKVDADAQLQIKPYKRRWLILFIFFIYAGINSMQWVEYSSMTSLVVKYYKVSTLAVDWTSILYMALYPIFVIPASYIIDKKGLRAAGLIGCIGTAIGTGIKIFSVHPDRFYIVLIGQAIVSASQIVIICLPPKIAAVWFKPNEVSTACSLGVIGTQLGCAIGYILPPSIVKNSDNLEEIGDGLYLLCWILTISMIPATIALIAYFPAQPILPPSAAQANIRQNKAEFNTKMFFDSIKQLFLNKPFLIHMVAYSINIAVFSAVGTLLTQFIGQYFMNATEDAGRMGFIMVVAGTVGSIVFGVLLDKTHKYKEITFINYLGAAVSVYMLMYSLEWKSLILTYISCAILGQCTMSGFLSIRARRFSRPVLYNWSWSSGLFCRGRCLAAEISPYLADGIFSASRAATQPSLQNNPEHRDQLFLRYDCRPFSVGHPVQALNQVKRIAAPFNLEGFLLINVVFFVVIIAVSFSVFTNAYMPVGFELAMELTYPSEESTTTGILMAMTQVLGVVFAVALGYLNLWVGCYWSLFSQGVIMILGTVITGCIPNQLRRQEAFRQNLAEKQSHHGWFSLNECKLNCIF